MPNWTGGGGEAWVERLGQFHKHRSPNPALVDCILHGDDAAAATKSGDGETDTQKYRQLAENSKQDLWWETTEAPLSRLIRTYSSGEIISTLFGFFLLILNVGRFGRMWHTYSGVSQWASSHEYPIGMTVLENVKNHSFLVKEIRASIRNLRPLFTNKDVDTSKTGKPALATEDGHTCIS